jgi:hypothetical protein
MSRYVTLKHDVASLPSSMPISGLWAKDQPRIFFMERNLWMILQNLGDFLNGLYSQRARLTRHLCNIGWVCNPDAL